MKGTRTGALLLATLLVSVNAAAADSIQTSGTLPHGGSYTLYQDTGIGTSAIGIWFRAPSDGYDGTRPGLARVAATAIAAAKLESGRSLVQLVRAGGGRITVSVFSDLVGVTALVPAPAARSILAAMTSAYFSPNIDDAALKDGQRDAAVLSAQEAYSSEQLLRDEVFGQMFASGTARVAPLPSAIGALTDITLSEVTSFSKRAFRSGNAFVELAGNVDASALDAITAGTSGAPDAPIDSTLASSPTEKVTSANVSGIGLGWAGPPIRDERAATALDFVADYLFRDGSGVVAKAIDAQGQTYVSGQFITLHDPGVMMVAIDGDATAAAKASVLEALQQLSKPLDAATFNAARNAFLYHLAADLQVPSAESDNLGWYAAEGNATYAPGSRSGTYVDNARALDPAYVASVVRQYLAHPVVVQLLSVSKESSS